MILLPEPGLYRHFRNGKLYRLLFIAKRSEEEGKLDVIYLPLYESEDDYMAPAQAMSRPVGMWSEQMPVTDDCKGFPHYLHQLDSMGSERSHESIKFCPRFFRVGD